MTRSVQCGRVLAQSFKGVYKRPVDRYKTIVSPDGYASLGVCAFLQARYNNAQDSSACENTPSIFIYFNNGVKKHLAKR